MVDTVILFPKPLCQRDPIAESKYSFLVDDSFPYSFPDFSPVSSPDSKSSPNSSEISIQIFSRFKAIVRQLYPSGAAAPSLRCSSFVLIFNGIKIDRDDSGHPFVGLKEVIIIVFDGEKGVIAYAFHRHHFWADRLSLGLSLQEASGHSDLNIVAGLEDEAEAFVEMVEAKRRGE
ncbi:hypothetical protein ACLOJK_034597 [Asimina triloba]